MIRQVKQLVLGHSVGQSQKRDLHPQSSADLEVEAGEGIPGSVKGVGKGLEGGRGALPTVLLGEETEEMKRAQVSDSCSPQTHRVLLCWRTQPQDGPSAQAHREHSVPTLSRPPGAVTARWQPGPGIFLQTDYIITSREASVVRMTDLWSIDPHNWNHLDF